MQITLSNEELRKLLLDQKTRTQADFINMLEQNNLNWRDKPGKPPHEQIAEALVDQETQTKYFTMINPLVI